jgi:uncharacterized protein YjbI with pentapeptide repeats
MSARINGSLVWLHARINRFVVWLREHGSWPALGVIVVLSAVSIGLVSKGGATRWAILSMVGLGIALVLGCLFAFPYAQIWQDDDPGSAEERHKFINDLRTMLISIVVGAFALVTIYLTFVSAQAAARSAQATEAQQKFDRLASASDLMDSDNAAVRLIGVATLQKLILDKGIDAAEGYRALTVYVRDRSPWTKARREQWERLVPRHEALPSKGKQAERNPRVGVGSLRKRAPDVQAALSVVSSARERPPEFRADFQDADLQGVMLGRVQLAGALFNGAHLDYLDTRTGEPPYANLARAEFKGARMYGAYFHNAELGGARFETPQPHQVTDLRYAEFRGASAVETHFEGADLRWAVFTRFKARPTILQRAHFFGANLTGAVFDGADLTGADFREANLEGASFKGANLTGVNFDYAELTDVVYDSHTTWPAGFYAPPDQTVIEPTASAGG